jgi:hypothetical protein
MEFGYFKASALVAKVCAAEIDRDAEVYTAWKKWETERGCGDVGSHIVQHHFDGDRISGLASEPSVPGWRRSKATGFYVPRKTTRAGRAELAIMEALPVLANAYSLTNAVFGKPFWLLGMRAINATFFRCGEDVVVGVPMVDGRPVDSPIGGARMKASEFYAFKARMEALREAGGGR